MKKRRAGAALLVTMFAAMVIGVAAVALFQAHRLGATRVEITESQQVARWGARGAVHRALSSLRVDPTLRGTLPSRGPEAVLGVSSTVTISLAGSRLAIDAVSQYRGISASYRLEVDPLRL